MTYVVEIQGRIGQTVETLYQGPNWSHATDVWLQNKGNLEGGESCHLIAIAD